MTAKEMRQAWCSRPSCDGGAKVGEGCPPAWLSCVFCGAPLTFVEPRAKRTTAAPTKGEP